MKLSDCANIYDIICENTSNIDDRIKLIALRRSILNKTLVKTAFDSRRTNQAIEYNPRRNLQYYHRSEAFITKDASDKLKTFFKLKTAVDSVKDDFIGDPDWLDSYCRILSATLDRTLRVDQKDMDFFKPQMDYLEELLYLRYRLKSEDINRLGEIELRSLILDKDERLMHKNIYANYNNGGINKNSNTPQLIKGQDLLTDKLFGDVKASKENKNVERSVTITINDKIIDDIKKEG